jgi:hypothetical protein
LTVIAPKIAYMLSPVEVTGGTMTSFRYAGGKVHNTL